MDIHVEVDLKGVKNLEQKGEQVKSALLQVIQEYAQRIFAESQTLVPVATGALRSSGVIATARDTYTQEVVGTSITYGGDGVDYAVVVHEDLSFQHSAPTQAKYLEVPMLRNAKPLAEAVRERLRVILGN